MTDAERDRADTNRFQGMVIRMTHKLNALRALVDEQAEDEDLWDMPVDCDQAEVLQTALRKLHALIEERDEV